jgi:hypothetical protein
MWANSYWSLLGSLNSYLTKIPCNWMWCFYIYSLQQYTRTRLHRHIRPVLWGLKTTKLPPLSIVCVFIFPLSGLTDENKLFSDNNELLTWSFPRWMGGWGGAWLGDMSHYLPLSLTLPVSAWQLPFSVQKALIRLKARCQFIRRHQTPSPLVTTVWLFFFYFCLSPYL